MSKKSFLQMILLLIAALSCTKPVDTGSQEPDMRYYVKYEVGTFSGLANATMEFTYSFVDEKNQEVSGTYHPKQGATQTYGPVSKGFVAKAEAYMNINYNSTHSGQPVNIYVSINEEPFTLKASGNGSVSYKIE